MTGERSSQVPVRGTQQGLEKEHVMEDSTPHYLRFARTLALATTIALPACGGSEDPAPQPEEHRQPPATTATTASAASAVPTAGTGGVAAAEPTLAEDAGASPDASYGHVSGPLPPPEMPASLASLV
jgi:hypothetical protein